MNKTFEGKFGIFYRLHSIARQMLRNKYLTGGSMAGAGWCFVSHNLLGDIGVASNHKDAI